MKWVQSLSKLRTNTGLFGLLSLSLALHGTLLFVPVQWLPLAQEDAVDPIVEFDEELPESGAIALVTLPPVAEPELPPEEVPAPPLVVEPTSLPLAAQEPVVAAIPEAAEPETVIEPEIREEPNPEPEEIKEDPEPEPEAGIAVRFSNDFPHIAEAASGCFGLENCRTIAGQGFRDVANVLLQSLEAKGYELIPEDNGDESGGNHRIYKMVSPPDNQIKYLNIFGEGLTGASYLITAEPVQRDDLVSLNSGTTL